MSSVQPRRHRRNESTSSVGTSGSAPRYKRRYCKVSGCTNIVKSQGVCQRHGAKTRKCKVKGCNKNAQGNFDGCCKAHFKELRRDLKGEEVPEPVQHCAVPPQPEGESVYDRILPASLAYVPNGRANDMTPLAAFLKAGFDESRPRGWHRNQERRARGLLPVPSPAAQLEGWERQLVMLETCVLSGTPQVSFRHLARAWGRDKGFHMVLAQYICDRRGDCERKKRVGGPPGRRKRVKREASDDVHMDFLFDEMEPLELLDFEHQPVDYEGDIPGSIPAAKKMKPIF